MGSSGYSGNSGFSGLSGYSGVSGFSGKSGFSGITGTSDIRFKKDIRAFTDGLSTLGRIRPVTYKWNGLGGRVDDGEEVIGVIGQELESVAPYAVVRSRQELYPGGHKTEIVEIDGTALIMLLVNSLRELDDRLTALKRKKGLL